jgi:hypothetical protein
MASKGNKLLRISLLTCRFNEFLLNSLKQGFKLGNLGYFHESPFISSVISAQLLIISALDSQ